MTAVDGKLGIDNKQQIQCTLYLQYMYVHSKQIRPKKSCPVPQAPMKDLENYV